MFNKKRYLSKHPSERLKSMQEEIEILAGRKYATNTIYTWRREISKGNKFYWKPLRSTALVESDNYSYDSAVIIPPITVKKLRIIKQKIVDMSNFL